MCEYADVNYYYIDKYICTLTKHCFMTSTSNDVLGFTPSLLALSETFVLTESCIRTIISMIP